MRVDWTPEQLIAFEDEIAQRFLAKEIRAPVHLAGGNERQLIEVFRKYVEPQDWLCCAWRSHYHCLLKGVPVERVREEILMGHSISLCFPEHKIISSAIAGGIAPIAAGLALGIKRKGEDHKRKVVCFLGDMTARMGVVREAMAYCDGFDLPILWVIEDNGLSVGSKTEQVWGHSSSNIYIGPKYVHYVYHMTRPHVGVGLWVSF